MFFTVIHAQCRLDLFTHQMPKHCATTLCKTNNSWFKQSIYRSIETPWFGASLHLLRRTNFILHTVLRVPCWLHLTSAFQCWHRSSCNIAKVTNAVNRRDRATVQRLFSNFGGSSRAAKHQYSPTHHEQTTMTCGTSLHQCGMGMAMEIHSMEQVRTT